ncbi:MAG TPA: hypothetical protein DEQ84_06230 [Prevotellaceae bacterium]|nr:hypothetical protein [Prevotellaceae bacterium]
MTGYKCPLTKPVTSLRIKTDKVTADLIYTHFTDCQIHIDGVNLAEYANKIRQNATTIEMWNADTLVGLCACYMNDYATQTAYITHIAISPQYRGFGYGKYLLEQTIAVAIEKGFLYLNLEVLKTNIPALTLYQSYHFTIIEDRNTKYLMSLHLADKSR